MAKATKIVKTVVKAEVYPEYKRTLTAEGWKRRLDKAKAQSRKKD